MKIATKRNEQGQIEMCIHMSLVDAKREALRQLGCLGLPIDRSLTMAMIVSGINKEEVTKLLENLSMSMPVFSLLAGELMKLPLTDFDIPQDQADSITTIYPR